MNIKEIHDLLMICKNHPSVIIVIDSKQVYLGSFLINELEKLKNKELVLAVTHRLLQKYV